MGDILKRADYDAVRDMLGVENAVVLTDERVEGLAFLEYVEGEVKALFSTWQTIRDADDQDTKRLQLGVASWTAARLCRFMQRQDGRAYKVGDYSQSGAGLDWLAKARELANDAAKYLSLIAGATVPGRAKLMVATGPTSSGTNVPTEFEEILDKIQPTVIDWLEDLQS